MADGVVEIDVELDSSDAESKGAKLAGNLAKLGAAAGAAIGAATVAVAKQALDMYASYEQLAGGVDTLFKESSDTVKDYAAEAYKTSGMSANQYMETVTSFSASLINSLGGDTAAAAEYADLAIRDMADNANKMGTSIEVIQDTYASLARGNYAMLDNLKLGYSGTKEGLEELMEAAEKYQASQGNMVDYSVDSYADIVQAIHDVQVAQGLAGATAAEAATTIEGSVNSAKAAWDNWLTGLGDSNADMVQLTKNLVDSIITMAGNIGPRLVAIVTALGETLTTTFIDDMLGFVPQIIETAVEFFTAFIDALPGVVQRLIDNLPSLIALIAGAIVSLAPVILEAAFKMFVSILDGLQKAQVGIIEGFASFLKNVVDMVSELPSKMLEIGGNIVSGLWNGIINAKDWLLGKISGFASTVVDGIKSFFGINSPSTVMRDQVGRYMAEGVAVGFEKYNPVKDIQDTLLTDVTSMGMSARLSYAGNTTTNYFTIERIDAHDMAGVDNVNRLIELFNMNA